MRSWMAVLVAGMLIGPLGGSSVAFADTPVSSDVLAVVDAAHTEWQSSLGVRQDCSKGASIVYAEIVGRRGEYRTAAAEVVIDPAGGSEGLDAIVVHELSHHTFLACGAFADAELRDAFYSAQGIPADRDWFDYSHGWAATPAEQFAETMAVVIVGASEGDVQVSNEAVTVISRWLAGAPLTQVEKEDPQPYSSGAISTAPVDVGGRAPSPEEVSPAEPRVVAPKPATTERRLSRQGVYWLSSGRAFGPI